MSWQEICLGRIRERNHIETFPYSSIYSSNEKLWKDNTVYETVQADVKLQLALLHHEIIEFSNRGDYQGGLNLCSNKLYVIEEELRRKHKITSPTDDTMSDINGVLVSRLINNLKTKVSNLNDELILAKEALTSSHERILSLEKEIKEIKASKSAQNPIGHSRTPGTTTPSINSRRPSNQFTSRK